MVVAHDAGRRFSDQVSLRATASTFPAGTGLSLAHGAPGASTFRSFGTAGDPLPFTYSQVRGPQLLFRVRRAHRHRDARPGDRAPGVVTPVH